MENVFSLDFGFGKDDATCQSARHMGGDTQLMSRRSKKGSPKSVELRVTNSTGMRTNAMDRVEVSGPAASCGLVTR